MAYPTNTNKRVIYATQGVAVGDIGATSVIDSYLRPYSSFWYYRNWKSNDRPRSSKCFSKQQLQSRSDFRAWTARSL